MTKAVKVWLIILSVWCFLAQIGFAFLAIEVQLLFATAAESINEQSQVINQHQEVINQHADMINSIVEFLE